MSLPSLGACGTSFVLSEVILMYIKQLNGVKNGLNAKAHIIKAEICY